MTCLDSIVACMRRTDAVRPAKALLAAVSAFSLACMPALADAPATATWIGGGDRAVVTDPANWQCKDASGNVMEGAIPDASATAVSVTGETTFNFPAGQTAIWKSLSVSGTVTLAADCDWRGAGSLFGGFVAANTTLNMKGHSLYVKMPNGGSNRRINVTDDSPAGSGGQFHMEVDEGTQYGNNSGWNSDNVIWFSGSVEVVKDGKGTYVPNYANGATGMRYYQQTGGTRIHEGLVFLANDAEGTKNEAYYAQANRPVFGANGSAITIEAGGTLDYKGIYDLHLYKMYINGGTFTNTRMPKEPGWGSNGAIDFGADSFVNVARTAHIGGPFHLHGHTLTATIAANQIWHCRSGSAVDGTVKLAGDGVFQTYGAIDASTNATYDVACALDIAQPIAVSNYVARYEGDSNSGTAEFRVHGTFTPVTDNFYPATMQNGSTIDLSGRSGAWSSTGTFGALKFASGALVTIDVGARSLAHGERVLAWSAVPENVAFRIAGTAIAATESARIEADGVYYDVPDANVVAVAHWTGVGAHNDFNDPANWACTNMVGAAMSGAVPGERSSVFFGAFNFDLADAASVAKLSTYQSVALEPPMALATDCDWSGMSVNDRLFEGATIDLAGHSLRITCPGGTSQYAFTVTDSAEEGGSFAAVVPDGAVFENTLITIGGTVAFVKDGAGVFVAHRYDQPYTGGNTVAGGTLRFFNDAVADSSTYSPNKGYAKPLGQYDLAVRVEAGAFYDINGVYDNNCYPVVLAGGALTSSKKQMKWEWGGLGCVTLEADSAFDMRNSIVFINWDGNQVFNLNGHTLNIAFPEDAADEDGVHFYCRGLVASNGTLAVTGKGKFDVNGSALEARTATLDLASSATLNAAANVSNYVARYSGDRVTGGSNPVNVYGAFKPVADRMCPTVLHDGATMDLSALSGAMKTSSPIGALSFDAAASNITINVGARELQAEEQLVAWAAKPDGVEFSLRGDNVQAGDTLCVIENGIFYNIAEDSRLVTSATWTGQAGDGDISNSANWSCVNAHGNNVPNGVPGVSAKVHVSGAFGAGIPSAAAMPWQSVTFGSISLISDMDMRGLGSFFACVDATSTIDLRGHKLFVNTPNGNPPVALTVTDSTTDSSKPGELHIAVPAGATFTNNRVTLSGNLKLVKEGAGTFTPQVYRLAYTGGNVVAEGSLKLYNGASKDTFTYAFGQNSYPNPLGAYGTVLTVEEGCEFDINGVYDTNKQHFRLNGGAIVNSRGQGESLWGGFGNATLAADSTVTVGNNIVWTGPIDFGGNALACSIASGKTFFFRGTATDGTLRTTGAGTLQVATAAGSQTMDLDAATALNVAAALTVRDYTARYEGTSNAGSAAMNVYGTFTPVTDNFYGCTMLNGSTLDLTSKTDVWSTKGAFTSGLNTVTFAENAVVNVALSADRELLFDENGLAQVVAWEEEPPVSTTFKLAGPALQNRRSLLRKPGGLYLLRASMMILFR